MGVCTKCGECMAHAVGVQPDVGGFGGYRGVEDGRAGAGVWLFCRYSPCSINSMSFPSSLAQSLLVRPRRSSPSCSIASTVSVVSSGPSTQSQCVTSFSWTCIVVVVDAHCTVVVMDMHHVTCWVCGWYGGTAFVIIASVLFPLVVFYLFY